MKRESILLAIIVEHDRDGAEVVLVLKGERVATGITAPSPNAAVKLLADRLAGLAP